MKSSILKLMIAFGVLLCPVAAQQREEPITNTAVIKLVRAGFKDKTVIAIIQTRPNRFQLEPERLIELKRNGVSENVILAMLALEGSQIPEGEEWANDEFFRDRDKVAPSIRDNNSNDSVDIFGSGGSSSNETSGRGTRQGNQNDMRTTGSATVRILRPAVEAGNQPLKLEKTPTLNNESIVQLVEAGFSEGTIIQRIENSPADFDMSPAKLDELRKRRVSEPIILAMMAAMDDSSSKPSHPGAEK
jgi:hypothetical protein